MNMDKWGCRLNDGLSCMNTGISCMNMMSCMNKGKLYEQGCHMNTGIRCIT